MTVSVRASGFPIFAAAALALCSSIALAQLPPPPTTTTTTVDPTAGVPSIYGTTATPVLVAQAPVLRLDKLTRLASHYEVPLSWGYYLGSTGFVLEHYSDAAGTIKLAAAPPLTTTARIAYLRQPTGVPVMYSRVSVYGPAGKLDQSNVAKVEFPAMADSAPQVWTQLSGAAQDIGLGGTGMWAIGTNVSYGGYGLNRWVDGAWVAVLTKGGGKRVDVDASGMPWVVDGLGNVQRHTGTSWAPVMSGATDVGVGANGTAWIISNVAEGGGFGIFRGSAGTPFTKVPGGAVRVDVDPQGNAWVVNSTGAIYRWNGTGWTVIPLSVSGGARDIGIGADGSVFVSGKDNATYRWNGTGWVKRDGAGISISADPTGVPVRTDLSGNIYRGWK